MKVTVKGNYLNVRVGKPDLNAPCYQYIAPGSELEVDGHFYKGDIYDGIDTWLKDAAGNFYWSGGVNEITQPQENRVAFGWFNQLGISDVWSTYHEKGGLAKVAVLDTGYNKRNVQIEKGVIAEKVIIDKENYAQASLVIEDRSSSGHGSRCASLVGARNTSNWMIGIAPECELLIGKISINREVRKFDYIFKGIEWAISQGADIITVSYACEFNPEETALWQTKLEALLQHNNVIIFAAAGNTNGNRQEGERFPASYPGCVSVGATDQNNNLSFLTMLSNKTILHAPGIGIEAFGKNDIPDPESGTSFSTPIIAGITALAVSFLKRNGRKVNRDDLINKLVASGDPISGFENKKNINIENLFKKLLQ